ncbi:hypothetical protein [Bacteroides finegoldii]|jgi:hypothetical protein|uniref:hypothetical protein n=1 Tax=Bacteroides finegoldii TaxID=338188 RepID=UPI00189D7AB0|nr:hypothetical protein [Bacteroides finegoldii]MDC7140311.1 hypothetical protein [Bacteroides finegoldii]
MKRRIDFLVMALFAVLLLTSCERVAPNYAGVLMENFGKQGKEDFKVVSGKVSTWEWGTELFQVPLFDQRGEFADPVTLKAADNTEFNARPAYSYKVIKDKAVDVVFDNKHIDKADTESGKDGFMQSLEDNILEPRIYDLIKEESRKHKTDSLMADGGSLLFEKRLELIVDKEFEKRGLQLLTFSAQLEFSKAVREKIDSRNEVNTNISVLDQQISEQRKRNELEQLKTEQALITSRGLTREILYKQFIDKWDGKTPLYGIAPEFLKITE